MEAQGQQTEPEVVALPSGVHGSSGHGTGPDRTPLAPHSRAIFPSPPKTPARGPSHARPRSYPRETFRPPPAPENEASRARCLMGSVVRAPGSVLRALSFKLGFRNRIADFTRKKKKQTRTQTRKTHSGKRAVRFKLLFQGI